jgi:2-succinyl-5-enolpyruvyl-6-hydroxy-3-cyclohexene-1-carboxylate synthase
MKDYLLSSANVNTLWGRVIIDELARCGVRYIIVSPGSRSTPLTLAAAEHPDITDISILDERSAAFFALGIAKESRTPAALICTSGTAAANYYPAICEAMASQVPLLVLSADRPKHLSDSGAPQTMHQLHLYGSHVKHFLELAQAEADGFKLRALRSSVSNAVGVASEGERGPVHLNVPFRKPLEPTQVDEGHHACITEESKQTFKEGAFGRSDGGPYTRLESGTQTFTANDIQRFTALIQRAERPLIIAGPDINGMYYRDELLEFSKASGIPVFAEALSNVRFNAKGGDGIISSSELLLRSKSFTANCSPDLIIRLGAAPTNKMMQDFLALQKDVLQVQISSSSRRVDPDFSTSKRFHCSPAKLLSSAIAVLEHGPDLTFDAAWIDWLYASDKIARDTLATALEESTDLNEAAAFHEIASLMPEGSALMLSNSMTVRDMESWGMPNGTTVDVFCNRGVNGIDGVTSTALGIARSRGSGTVLVTGDLAFLHDINGFWAAREGSINATIVVINNNGGEIFNMLPVKHFEPAFTKHFTTAHNMDLSKIGELFGIEYYKAMNAYQLQTFLKISLDAPGLQIIEIPSDQKQEVEIRKALISSVTNALDQIEAAPSSTNTRKYDLHVQKSSSLVESDSAPALLLHGFTRSSASWDAVVSGLPMSRDFYTMDLMGHGSSPSPEFEAASGAYSMEYQAERIHERIVQSGIAPLHLCGYSMGGRLALYFALHYPEDLASLTLISASPGIEDDSMRTERSESDAALAGTILTDGLERFVGAWSSSEIVASGVNETARIDGTRDRLKQSSAGLRGSLLGMGQGVQPNLWPRLAEMSLPVSLIAGESDAKYVAVMSKMSEAIKGSKLQVLAHGGHDLLSAQANELAQQLDTFWDENEQHNR